MTFTCPATSPNGDRCHNPDPHYDPPRNCVHWSATGSDVANAPKEEL